MICRALALALTLALAVVEQLAAVPLRAVHRRTAPGAYELLATVQ